MINFEPFLEYCERCGLNNLSHVLAKKTAERFDANANKDLKSWLQIIQSLPEVQVSDLQLDADTVQIGRQADCSAAVLKQLETQLMELHPWRKGPFNLFGIFIDTEWRSDWKWRRLAKHISPLKGRLVLDIGCGNGYHLWRMAGSGAKLALGIDPFLKSVMQFQFLQKYIHKENVNVLPIGIEDLPKEGGQFDTVFSMGVLYHRRSPVDHLYKIRSLLRSGGEAVLETLVIEGKPNEVLLPQGRYAKMRNVWFIPSVLTLEGWLRRCGFKKIRLADVSKTTTDEQRSTRWMRYESLPDFLDPNNNLLTIEGLPAPTRAIFLAEAP